MQYLDSKTFRIRNVQMFSSHSAHEVPRGLSIFICLIFFVVSNCNVHSFSNKIYFDIKKISFKKYQKMHQEKTP